MNAHCEAKEEKTCPICVGDLAKDEETRLNKCKHTYHYPCIKQWVLTKEKSECPMCRCSFDKLIKKKADGTTYEEIKVSTIKGQHVVGTCQRCNQNISNAVMTEVWETGANGSPVYRGMKCDECQTQCMHLNCMNPFDRAIAGLGFGWVCRRCKESNRNSNRFPGMGPLAGGIPFPATVLPIPGADASNGPLLTVVMVIHVSPRR